MPKIAFVTTFSVMLTLILGGCTYLPGTWKSECRTFPQKVMVHNRSVQGYALACNDEQGVWHTMTFKDKDGNDLPAPSEILYPQPDLIQTRPKTAFTPSQPVNNMPLPPVTVYSN